MTQAQLRDLYLRRARALARRPGFGAGSGRTRVCLTGSEGLRCEADHGAHAHPVDAACADGGDGAAPSPADLLRASIGASVAIGCRIAAARRGVSLAGVSVEVTAEYDDRGALGLAPEIPVGWRRVVVAVAVTSTAPEAELREVVTLALRDSTVLANLSPAIARAYGFSMVRPG